MRPSTILGLVSFLCAIPQPASAFLPTETRSLGGRLGISHIVQTRVAIESLWWSYFGMISGSSKMRECREQIAEANADVDDDQEHAELHFDGESFVKGQMRLIDLSKNVVSFMKLKPSDGYAARRSLGQALHTLQDFYSHTNWIEILKSQNLELFPHPGLGVYDATIEPLGKYDRTCDQCDNWPFCGNCKNNLLTNWLTSGYYSGEPEFPKPGNWKCSHGGPFDGSSGGLLSSRRGQGINKDSTDCLLSPHHHLHADAARISIEATKKYINEIRNQLTDDETKILFGVKTSSSIWGRLPFPFTASGVAVDLIEKIRNHIDDDDKKRDTSSLSKRAMTSEINSHVYVRAENVHEDAKLLARAMANGKVHPIQYVRREIAPGARVSEFGWKDIAQATGGQLLRVAENETAEAAVFLDMISQEDYVEILSVGGKGANHNIEYSFPIDSTLKSLLISAAGVSGFELFLPNGTQLPTDSNPSNGVMTTQLTSNIALNITSSPPVGRYRIVLHSDDEYTLSVSGKSNLSLSSFEFVKKGGRAGHEGFFPIATAPITGQVFGIEAYVDGEFKNPNFEFRSQTNELIAKQTFVATGSEDGIGGYMFEGNTTAIPDADFRVYLTGVDAQGKEFQRAFLSMISSSKVAISFPKCNTLHTGVQKKVRVTVKNLNNVPDTFTITAIDEKNVITKVSKSSMSLKAGAKGYFDITLNPGSDVSTGTNHMVVVVEGKKTAANSAIVKMIVEPKSFTEQSKATYETYWANETMLYLSDPKFLAKAKLL